MAHFASGGKKVLAQSIFQLGGNTGSAIGPLVAGLIVGLIAGLFFGLAFGMGGLGSAVLRKVADMTSIKYLFKVCTYLPLIGVFTGLLPNIEGKKAVS